jgi:hypothetical protein
LVADGVTKDAKIKDLEDQLKACKASESDVKTQLETCKTDVSSKADTIT